MIKANNLTMIYGGDFKSVDNLTFNVKKGEILASIGDDTTYAVGLSCPGWHAHTI
jgi:ABC-type Na+ transport system ATPase subunit NatA